MATETSSPANRGWTVTFAGLGINLALGILYTWSMIKEQRQQPVVSVRAD